MTPRSPTKPHLGGPLRRSRPAVLRRPRLALVAALLALAALSSPPWSPAAQPVVARPAAGPELVADGDFALPAVPAGGFSDFGAGQVFGSWTVATGSVDLLSTPRWQAPTAAAGSQSVDLNGSGPGGIYQDLATRQGSTYRLTFAMAGNPEADLGPKQLAVRWGGTVVDSPSFDTTGHTNDSMGWTFRTYTVTASAARTRLQFDSVNTPGAFGPTVGAVSVAGASSGPPPPVLGKSVDAAPVSGVVRVLVPGSGAHGFVALTAGRQLPVGTIFDTAGGVVSLTSGTAVRGVTQSGNFGGGLFRVGQNPRERGLTEVALASLGSSTKTCQPAGGKARTAAKRKLPKTVLNLLRADAKGRFRTRGRFSSATVRGTSWTTFDRCDGTLTTVARGVVTVRDFRLKRNVVVRAGRSYLATGP